MIRTYTGTRGLTSKNRQLIRYVIANSPVPDEFVSGCAVGTDTVAAMQSFARYPEKKHTLVVPAMPHNNELVEFFETLSGVADVEIVRMPYKTTYLDRDQELVDRGEELYAFPRGSKEVLRSGTWATVRRARDKAIPIYFYPLDGTSSWKENV